MAELSTVVRLHCLPEDFATLLVESEVSGYRMLRRVFGEWESGANRFLQPGEALFGAEIGSRLIGVCGLNIDPYLNDSRVGRVRNVYVLAGHRGHGTGWRLVQAAIEAAKGHFDTLRLRAVEPGPARLYESIGFRACRDTPNCTHVLNLECPDR